MSTPSPDSPSQHPKGSRFLAAMFAVLGAFFILLLVETGYVEMGGPEPMLEAIGGTLTKDGVVISSSYELYAFGSVVLRRENVSQRQYHVESLLWMLVPACFLIATGAIIGWFAGRVFAYRFLRPSRCAGCAPPCIPPPLP